MPHNTKYDSSILLPIRWCAPILACCLACLFSVSLNANDEDTEDKKNDGKKDRPATPLTVEGPIQKVSEPVSEMVNLSWAQNKLMTKMPLSYDEAEYPVDAIREEFGYGDGSEYGSPTYRLGFGDTKAVGFVERTKEKGKGYSIRISIREISKPFRELSISESEAGEFRTVIRSPKTGFIMRVIQAEDDKFTVQIVDGVDVTTAVAANFNGFMNDHRQFAKETVLPAFEAFGIGKILSPYSDSVQQKVIEHLTPLKTDRQQAMDQLAERLASEVYEDRLAVTESLRDEYPTNLDLMMRGFLDRELNPEVRSRLRTVILDQADQEDIDLMEFLLETDLLNQVQYMVWILDNDIDESQKQHVTQRLQYLTGDDISPDSPRWEEWLASQPFNQKQPEIEPPPEIDFSKLITLGKLANANEHTSQIVRIQFNEDNLALDREHWSKSFAGKEIKELTKELEEEFTKRNIPLSWLNRGGPESFSESGHAQVMFELMKQALKGDSSDFVDQFDNRGENADWTLSFTAKKMRAYLAMSNKPQSRRRRRRESKTANLPPFHFYVGETGDQARELAIDEAADEFKIDFVCSDQDLSIHYLQHAEGVILQDFRGMEIQSLQGENFRELYEKNKAYFDEQLLPLMQSMGIHFETAIAPPLDLPEPAADGENSDESDSSDQ